MNTQFKAALLTEDTRFYEEIKAPSMEEQEIRLDVYRNNITVSLVEALCDIFPVTQTLVGDDFFRAMARIYVLNNPPSSPIIREYGQNFSDFVRNFEPAQSLPYLPDLAALEHAMLTLTHSEEYETLDHQAVSEAFASVEDPSVLSLGVPPTTQILVSPFAIGSLYQAHFSDGHQRLNQVDITKSEYLLLVKSHLYGQLHVIDKEEAIFIKNLMQEKTLENAIPESDAFDLGETLAKLIEWKILTNITQTKTN
ncbi:DNA-binding domain-containing protein [Marinomonas sp. GJ51-6]|uniref:DNA-binding domain-containing protein n=1 Tax=Marinomonas sp. GJ51-6 TaxID=2992802 RepID=UPI0029352455|nr:DNA-binding domain-containing protein [Marinomonas sp. GJ51-6]WOD09070.1 DNA-binding domain-containing protein [Marinomonas sp. GJ51-6]